MFYCLLNCLSMNVNEMLGVMRASLIKIIVSLISESMSINGAFACLDTTMIDFAILSGLFLRIKVSIKKKRLIAFSKNRVFT